MPPQYNLLKELQDHNDFFDSLVEIFPVKVYLTSYSVNDKYNSKYFKGQHKSSQEVRRAQAKTNKRIKLNPTVAEEETTSTTKTTTTTEPPESRHTSDATFASKDSKQKLTNDELSLSSSPSSRIEALRAKLQAKLASKRCKRPSSSNNISKRAARRAEKQRRQEEAKNRRPTDKVDSMTIKQYIIGKDPSPQKDLANIDFGKIAGLEKKKQFADNKSLSNINKKKNLQKMLADAEEKKRRLVELKQSGDKEKVDKMAWSDALKEARGERIKDDPRKLKKTLKQRINKKEKSAKAWKARLQHTKQKMDDRQSIRTHNLQKRREGGSVGANLSSKRLVNKTEEDDKKKSTRKSRAGFEGKKTGFLNGKSSSSFKD